MVQRLPLRRCAGIVLINRDRLVFAGRRIDMPGAWQMPQGGIDAGETPRQAALRELREETGTASAAIVAEAGEWLSYELPPPLLGKALRGRYRGQTMKWFAMRFSGRDDDIDIHGVAEPEFEAWRWMKGADIAASVVPFKRDIYARVFAGFAPLLA